MTYVSINLFLCFSLSYLLKVMCDALLKQGDPNSMKKRFALVTTFVAMGLTGELLCATWDSAEWDFELNNLMFCWNELKTRDSDVTNKNLTLKYNNLTLKIRCLKKRRKRFIETLVISRHITNL